MNSNELNLSEISHTLSVLNLKDELTEEEKELKKHLEDKQKQLLENVLK